VQVPTEPPVSRTSRKFAEFLESTPPDSPEVIEDLVEISPSGPDWLRQPEIRLHCDGELCNGIRTFFCRESRQNIDVENPKYHFLIYRCRNCLKKLKAFGLVVDVRSKSAQKLGENPPFGPPVPARLISLVGSDRELFLKGRRAELRGLGIGAFVYYRRVVEDKKGAIIKEIGKVAKLVGATPETLQLFAAAETETRFTSAIEAIKGAIPQALLINGQNPLNLLHSALSEGIHSKTDEECLELATSIRLVLIELADRIAIALKDEAGLRDAVNRLLKK
jgi:hypothetical protein